MWLDARTDEMNLHQGLTLLRILKPGFLSITIEFMPVARLFVPCLLLILWPTGGLGRSRNGFSEHTEPLDTF